MTSTIPLIYLTTFLLLFGETLQPAPRISIYESILCRQHYGALSNAQDCKTPAVQQQLATLIGIERLSIIIPCVLAIPFAALADRVGHARILYVAVFGQFLEEFYALVICWFPQFFPIKLIWLHFVFSFVGGGLTVVVSLLHVIVAEHVGPERRMTVFMRMRAAGVVASALGYAAAGASMKVNVWLPWGIGLLSMLLSAGCAMLLPENKVQDVPKMDDVGGWGIGFGSAMQFLKRVKGLLTDNRKVMVILILVFLCQLGFDAVPLMMSVYISKRFHWSFANVCLSQLNTRVPSPDHQQASFLNSLDMAMEFVTLLVLLPLALHFLSRLKFSPFAKDAYIAKASVALLAIGAVTVGLAPHAYVAVLGIAIIALGTGQDSALRSMTTDMVDPSGVSIVYSAITMLRGIGASISGPIYAGLYSVGLRYGEVWLGLPFVVAGLFFTVGLALLLCLKYVQGGLEDESLQGREDEEHQPLLQ
jgi:MFS family permease